MPRHRIRSAIVVTMVCGATHAMYAQPVLRTERVRVVELESRRAVVTGLLAGWEGNSVVIAPDDTRASLQRISLGGDHRLEVSAGRKRYTIQGFVLGALSGAVVGMFVPVGPACPKGRATCTGQDEQFGQFGPWGGAWVLAKPGAIIGALVGAATVREVWQPISSECQARRDSDTSRRSWPAAACRRTSVP